MTERRVDTTYLIIGNSAGGIAAAEAIREVDLDGALTIVGEEAFPAYSRPEIAQYLAGETEPARMGIRPAGFYEDAGIQALLGRRAESIDSIARTCRLDDDTLIGWEHLLLATGGRPIIPPIDGTDLADVYTFTTIADAARIKQAVGRGSRVAVIGGGLIGLSVTHALAHLGAPVTMVELLDRVLATALDAHASSVVERALAEGGVRLLLGQSATAIVPVAEGSGMAGGVALASGETLRADAVVIAVGVAPRAELAREAGIAVNRGILVDRTMRTSHPNIYACGDCAEGYDFVEGIERVVPVWPNAVMGGRVAGSNMAGRGATYAGAAGMNALSYFGLSIVAAGLQDAAGNGCEVLTHLRPDGSAYRKVVLRDGAFAGLTFVGEIEAAGIVFGLMRDGVDVSSFKEELVSPSLSMGGLPAALRKQRMAVPVGLVAAPGGGGHGLV